jgi:hypothetical protein
MVRSSNINPVQSVASAVVNVVLVITVAAGMAAAILPTIA